MICQCPMRWDSSKRSVHVRPRVWYLLKQLYWPALYASGTEPPTTFKHCDAQARNAAASYNHNALKRQKGGGAGKGQLVLGKGTAPICSTGCWTMRSCELTLDTWAISSFGGVPAAKQYAPYRV